MHVIIQLRKNIVNQFKIQALVNIFQKSWTFEEKTSKGEDGNKETEISNEDGSKIPKK
jgi:hypothetical protein